MIYGWARPRSSRGRFSVMGPAGLLSLPVCFSFLFHCGNLPYSGYSPWLERAKIQRSRAQSLSFHFAMSLSSSVRLHSSLYSVCTWNCPVAFCPSPLSRSPSGQYEYFVHSIYSVRPYSVDGNQYSTSYSAFCHPRTYALLSRRGPWMGVPPSHRAGLSLLLRRTK